MTIALETPQASHTASSPTAKRNYHLISADSHVNEPANLWVDRVPAKLRDRAFHVERFEQGDGWIIEGVDGPMPFGLNACAGQEPRFRQAWVHFEDIRPGGYDPKARLEEIDRAGVDAEVLYPTPRISQAIYATTDKELHLALVRAYNDWLDEYVSYDLSRFRALPILPNRGADMALEELERVGGRPSTGGMIMGAYPGGTLQPEPDDVAVLAAVAERGLPINIHVTMSNTMPKTVNTNALPAGNGSNRVSASADALTHMIFSGLFDQVPDLKVVFAEVDCGWVPYIKEQMDDGFLRYRFRYNLERLPSEYVERHAHFTFVTDNYAISNRHKIGIDKILWSSDYPHGNSNYPDVWPPMASALGDLPPDERADIRCNNALRLYHFDR